MRRENYTRIFREYVKEKCGKDGEQKSNMGEDEKDGMKRILKRREDKEAVIKKTDKLRKFTIATLDKYIGMGMKHVGDDKQD